MKNLFWTLLVLAPLAGCGDDEETGSGTLKVAIYGEDFIEQGIPGGAPGCDGCIEDGWSVHFDRFLIVVHDLAARGPSEVTDATARVFDLTRPSGGAGHAVTEWTAPAGHYHQLDYHVGPVAEAIPGNVDGEAVALMTDGGYALYVEGTATRDGITLHFAWGFTTDTRYEDCETNAHLSDGGEGQSQLTIHADHLFYDDLDSSTPQVVFDLIARADADADGQITQSELTAVDITGETRYQVGSRPVTDLWHFIETQARTVGHIDGEGHCEQR